MKAKTVLGVALGLWLVFLFALPSSAGEVSSVPKVNATLNCSPIKVTAVNTGGGIHFIANGTCEGYIINPTKLNLSPSQSVYHLGHWNVTGPFHRDYSILRVQENVYRPGELIPITVHFKMWYKPRDLLWWALRHDSINVSLYQFIWFHPIGEKNSDYIITIDTYWRGTLPVEIDWTSVLGDYFLKSPFSLGL